MSVDIVEVCGKCRMPLADSETGVRHYGMYRAHSEHRCIELLQLEAESLRAKLAAAEQDARLPENSVVAPNFRGYAHLGFGAGHYLLNHTAVGAPAELVIALATEAERAGRKIGERRDNEESAEIRPEDIAVRIRFESALALDVLEDQLRLLRADHFPGSIPGETLEKINA